MSIVEQVVNVEEKLKEAQLAKANLEQAEIQLRIQNMETPRERAIKLLFTVLVPLVTAVTAIIAAYVGLVSVQKERQQLSDEKAELQRFKETDFAKRKYDNAISLLSSTSVASDPKTALTALRELLLAGLQPTPTLISVVSNFIGHQDELLSKTAAEVLVQSGNPELVATATASRLLESTGRPRFELIKVLRALPPQKIEADLGRLIFAKDAVISGSAAMIVAGAREFSWSKMGLTDSTKSADELAQLFDLSLLQETSATRAIALARPIDALFRDSAVSVFSLPGRAACYFIDNPSEFPNRQDLRNRLNHTQKLHPVNRLMLYGILAEKEDREAATQMLHALRSDISAFVGLNRGILEYVARKLGIDESGLRVEFNEAWRTEAPPAGVAGYLAWKSVPEEVLQQWLRVSKKDVRDDADRSARSLATGAREELVRRLGEKAISSFEAAGTADDEMIEFWVRFDRHFDKALNHVKSLLRSPDKTRIPTGLVFRAIDKLKDSAKAEELLKLMSDAPFQFAASAIDMKNHHSQILEIIKTLRERGDISLVSSTLLLLHFGDVDIPQAWRSAAAEEAVANVEKLKQEEYTRNPSLFEDDVLRAMLLTSARSYRTPELAARLQTALANLPLITWTDRFQMISIGGGSITMRDPVYAVLYDGAFEGFLGRYRSASCRDKTDAAPKATSVAYRAVLAKYLLTKN